jgi:hypothetical protein
MMKNRNHPGGIVQRNGDLLLSIPKTPVEEKDLKDPSLFKRI